MAQNIKYKNQRNKVNMKKYIRVQFYENINDRLSQFNTQNNGNFWKLVRTLVKENNAANIIPPLADLSNSSINYFTDEENVNALINSFCSIPSVNDVNLLARPLSLI